MIIGIFTQPLKENYGGILQNMAIQRILRRMGHYPITIDYDTWRPPFWGRLRLGLERLIHRNSGLEFESCFARFVRAQINKTAKVTTAKQLRRCVRGCNFDAVIVGSDQVWRRDYNPRLDWAFLSFAGGLPRIAYAASIGVDYWDYTAEETSRCAGLLSDFVAVGVREASAVELCRKYLGREGVRVVLDPTMLLDAEDYPSSQTPLQADPYIFTYILDWDEAKGCVVDTIKRTKHLDELASEYNSTGSRREQRLSIEDWLVGISNADIVVCDSFHGTVFSILNHRPFVVLCNPARGNTRMQWLLELFGLQDRMIIDASALEDLKDIDWCRVDAKLNEERAASLSFLREALSIACRYKM